MNNNASHISSSSSGSIGAGGLSGSSSSQQHYAMLLNTVSELRKDLEKTMNKIQVLEDQNLNLTNNYQTVKDELVQTRFKYNSVKESYLNSVSEKFEAERQHEQFIEKLKVQLVEKTREFDLIRDKLIPHDIDQLRIKIQEELELQHKSELYEVENQLIREQDKLFQCKREYERGKVDYEVLIQHQQQEIQSIRMEREEVEGSLRDYIMKIREVEYMPSKDEKIRAQKNQIQELTHLLELVREEMKAIRSERDELVVTIDHMRSTYEASNIHMKSKLVMLETEKNTLEEQGKHYLNDSNNKDILMSSMKHSMEEMVAKMDFSHKEHTEMERSMAVLKEEHRKESEALHSSFTIERNECIEKMDALNARVLERDDYSKRLLKEYSELQSKHDHAINDLKRMQHMQLQDSRRKYVNIELELAELKSLVQLKDTEIARVDEAMKAQDETLTTEMSRVKRDKELLQQKVRELELLSDADKRKLSAIKQEYSSKLQVSETNHREALSKIASIEAQLVMNRNTCSELQHLLKVSRDDNQQLEEKNKEIQSVTESLRKEFQSQIDLIAPAFTEKANKLKKKMQMIVSKEKKRGDAYKNKVVEEHNKLKLLTTSIMQQQQQLQQEQQDNF